MPRVSKNPLSKETLEDIEKYFLNLVSSLTNEKEIEQFLGDFLTQEEKVMLAKRLVLYILLKHQLTPSAIQQSLKISRETVRTHTDQYESKSEVFHKTLDKLIQKEKSRELWKKLEKVLKPFDLALQAKTNMKARAKFASGGWS